MLHDSSGPRWPHLASLGLDLKHSTSYRLVPGSSLSQGMWIFLFFSDSPRIKHIKPAKLDDLCKQTKFTRQEIRVMYRGFKQVKTGTETGENDVYLTVFSTKHSKVFFQTKSITFSSIGLPETKSERNDVTTYVTQMDFAGVSWGCRVRGKLQRNLRQVLSQWKYVINFIHTYTNKYTHTHR